LVIHIDPETRSHVFWCFIWQFVSKLLQIYIKITSYSIYITNVINTCNLWNEWRSNFFLFQCLPVNWWKELVLFSFLQWQPFITLQRLKVILITYFSSRPVSNDFASGEKEWSIWIY
jgi:hypothetical protein